jgi:hypothetical protein
MSSHCKQVVFFVLLVCAFLSTSQTTRACSCGPKPTVLDSYDETDVVIIARILTVERAEANQAQQYVDGVRSATLRVEKVFKGNVSVRDELVFGQGGGADCIWTFNEKSIGDEVLLYLNSPDKISKRRYRPSQDPKLWFAGGCGRSGGIDSATDDLLYLEKMSKVRGKTRISGTIGGWQNPDINVDGKKIRIIGEKKTYVTKTNKQGVFEIYDLPPGKYFVEPEMPSGWKIDPYWIKYSPSVAERYGEGEPSTKRVEIVLQPKRHAGVDIVFAVDNVVRGKVLGPNGKPLQKVCVYLWDREQVDGFGPFDCTDGNGNFEITSVPSGEYLAVANRDGRLSTNHPFKTLYYPNVSERERAAIISVSPGDSISDINIVVPNVAETVTLEGVLLYSDGNPAIDEAVKFKSGGTDNEIDGDVTERTDSAGRFSLRILKGLSGELSGEDWVFAGKLENCPKVDELLAKSGRNNLTVQSNVLKLQADQNSYDLELRFPFPRCENAKK